ncbi:biotin transporter BioY [Canibacter sp. lx-72]|uniref:biotin transporter BioY n=1 Tax=Canibacter zhuwentaonis TaxID=2837491 RepID=UPI001BDD9401|nr:biotin transporter BioY [Canibacter zhuwentaonis]MBT1017771.1 biotin transporter BioY [Canibacter zhuwentaonis]MBT1034926.1 biotin transporter BioY [Canibacter zhuwentaonis]
MTSKPVAVRPLKITVNPAKNLALVAVFAAFIAVCAILPAVPIGSVAVPITLQTLAVYTAALVLGGKRALLATTLYVLAGLIGLPIFSGGRGGFGTVAVPSFGYLLGFIPGALAAGALAYTALRKQVSGFARAAIFALAALAGFAVIQVFGVAGLVINAHLELPTALAAALVYVPGDLVKCLLSVFIALAVHRAFPNLARR